VFRNSGSNYSAMRRIFITVILATGLWPLISHAQVNPNTNIILEGYFETVDGDTIKINNIKIRIKGIDAPDRQKHKPMAHWFDRSSSYMKLLLKNPLRCVLNGNRTYDRFEASCFILPTGEDLGALMVVSGYAVEWPSFSKGIYTQFENYAMLNKNGMWIEMRQSWR